MVIRRTILVVSLAALSAQSAFGANAMAAEVAKATAKAAAKAARANAKKSKKLVTPTNDLSTIFNAASKQAQASFAQARQAAKVSFAQASKYAQQNPVQTVVGSLGAGALAYNLTKQTPTPVTPVADNTEITNEAKWLLEPVATATPAIPELKEFIQSDFPVAQEESDNTKITNEAKWLSEQKAKSRFSMPAGLALPKDVRVGFGNTEFSMTTAKENLNKLGTACHTNVLSPLDGLRKKMVNKVSSVSMPQVSKPSWLRMPNVSMPKFSMPSWLSKKTTTTTQEPTEQA